MKILGIASGVLAFLGCFGAGLWLLFCNGFDLDIQKNQEDPLFFALALYFMGKGIFVGAMLILTSLKLSGSQG